MSFVRYLNFERVISITNMKGTLSHLYYINNQGEYECKVCRKCYPKIQNVCKHVRKKHIESDDELSQFTFKGTKILKSTERIIPY